MGAVLEVNGMEDVRVRATARIPIVNFKDSFTGEWHMGRQSLRGGGRLTLSLAHLLFHSPSHTYALTTYLDIILFTHSHSDIHSLVHTLTNRLTHSFTHSYTRHRFLFFLFYVFFKTLFPLLQAWIATSVSPIHWLWPTQNCCCPTVEPTHECDR